MIANTLYLPELREMLAIGDTEGLREFCTALHPARTAEFMEGLNAAESWQVLGHAESPLRTEIFTFFDPARQVEMIEMLDRHEMAHLVGELPPDDRVDILQDVSDEARGRFTGEASGRFTGEARGRSTGPPPGAAATPVEVRQMSTTMAAPAQ